MELGANFVSKLEPFLLMAKSMKGAAAAKLIQDATSAPGVFVFSELLDLPNVQELGGTQHEKFLSLLQLFAYKTYEDYVQHKDALPPLNQAQITKLKHLSIVTYASQRRILPYSDLLKSLDMPTVRELEDLIIDAIYLDILRGKLDQKQEQLEVEYTMGRDLEPGRLEHVLIALQDWASTTAVVLTTLDDKISTIAAEAAAAKVKQQEYDKVLQERLKEAHDKQKERSLGGGGSARRALGDFGNRERERDRDMHMDVDEPSENSKGKNRKASQEANPKPLRKRNKF